MITGISWYKNITHRLLYLTLVFVRGCLLTLATHAGNLREYREKTATPPVKLEDIQRQPHALADYKGQVILVNFWASWCAPCLQEIPEMRKLGERMAGRPFTILAINVEESKRKIKWLVDYLSPYMTILLDHDRMVFNAWDGTVLPTSYLLDGSGRIRYLVQGPLDWDSEEAVSAVEQLLQETTTTQTTGYTALPVH
jgi:thiol-disulfide isomerase/thioredoxin